MANRIWIKLYLEILNDPKMGCMPDWLWRRAIELFLLAGENGDDGLLQPVKDLVWKLRTSEEKLTASLQALSEVGVVHETPQGWVVTNFKERQYSDSYERTKRYRERYKERHSDGHSDGTCDGDVTNNDSIYYSSSSSVSDSEEGGVGGETRRTGAGKTAPGDQVEEEFVAHFGNFFSKRERERWRTLYEAIGFTRLQEIATWAERREIHMVNRGGLLDSLETAAKKWIDNTPKPKGDNTEFFKNLAVAAEVKT